MDRGSCRTLTGLLLAGAWIATAAQAAPPAKDARLPASDVAATALAEAAGPGKAVTIHLAPDGDDAGDGTAAHPFRTPERAQQAVRQLGDGRDVTVMLAAGTYRLEEPLGFGTADGGRNGHVVLWTSAPGARAILSGGIPVSGWKTYDAARGIYVADVPKGIEARQLYVDGALAPRARIEIARDDVAFTPSGLTLKSAKLAGLAALPGPSRIEVEGTGFFTDRFSPVERIDGMTVTMQQPGWRNNIWGYDTLANPWQPQFAHLYLVNALAFLRAPGQWYLDPAAGRLYLRPPEGKAIGALDVVLPRLPYLIGIAGTYAPVADLRFEGLRFEHTSWLGPLAATGYASQQSGAYLADTAAAYPADPLATCTWGCPQFETMRNEWHQMPAAIQVARATRIRFDRDVFAHLGQIALGIGNDITANASGIGLGADDVAVTRSLFTDLAGGAIMAGGVRRDAHHPADPRLIDRAITIAGNRIAEVSREYQDQAAILSTYAEGTRILHNDVSGAPYDGIDIGYGWGIQDAGGNPNYRVHMHGYDFAGNRVYPVPTTLRDTLVAANRVHDVKRHFEDGGAIYNLSANPGAVVRDNYVYDIHGHIGLYLDEGSQGLTLAGNVVEGSGRWLNANTVQSAYPMRITIDNKATGNWHDSASVGGRWDVYQNDLILDDHLVQGRNWPAAAKAVMDAAGIEPGTPIPEL